MKLTKAQERLLTYPPTKRTWICKSQYSKFEQDPKTGKAVEVPILCDMINSGRWDGKIIPNGHDRCSICGSPEPKKSYRLWNDYVELCSKVGLDPELPPLERKWPIKTPVIDEHRTRPIRRRA